jgi:hypothetical protein
MLRESNSPAAGAITRRILAQRSDLLAKYGPVKVMSAIDDVADFVGDVEEIGSSDVSGWVKHVEQMLGNMGESMSEGVDDEGAMAAGQLQNIAKKAQALAMQMTPDKQLDGWVQSLITRAETDMTDVHDFLGNFKQNVDEAEGNPTDKICVDVPLFIRLMEYAREDARNDMDLHRLTEKLTEMSAGGRTLTMDDYDSATGTDEEQPGQPSIGDHEVKEADMASGNQGYNNMLAVLKAVDAGQDATFDLGGEPVTLEYPEARFLAGKYKAFLKAGRQEEFLKYMNNPVAFDRLMKQLRDLIDKQKNFKGSVPGERNVPGEKSKPYESKVAVKPAIKESVLPKTKDNQYWCSLTKQAKPIPAGYKKTAAGYITRK